MTPFDITITFANEYGQMSVQRIFGVEILNAGAGLSVDDIVSEQQLTFVARSLLPVTPKETSSLTTGDGMVTWDQVNAMFKNQLLSPADQNLPSRFDTADVREMAGALGL